MCSVCSVCVFVCVYHLNRCKTSGNVVYFFFNDAGGHRGPRGSVANKDTPLGTCENVPASIIPEVISICDRHGTGLSQEPQCRVFTNMAKG